MKALLAKEIRLLLPAYGAALLLATVPVWLFPKVYGSAIPAPAFYLFCFGTVMLALSSFGREFGLKTFPLLLAQPLERGRIWWTKVGVLAGAMATVLGAWCYACASRTYTILEPEALVWREAWTFGGAAALVAFAGGLWTTLLLRQVAAAFWFTLLIPGAILTVLGFRERTEPLILPAMGLYAVAGFWWAWRYFLRVEEAAWTGGVVSLPGRRPARAASRLVRRGYRPWVAMVQKELQLHLVGLAGIAGLFLLHLGVVAVRKAGETTLGDTWRWSLEVFGGIWLLAPLLVGCPSVAEERKLGTLQEQLCLPLSSRVQFTIKLVMVLIVGGLLSAALGWTVEGIGSAVGLRSILGTGFQGQKLAEVAALFMGLSLLSFYASTLTRNLLQALALAVVTAIGVSLFIIMISNPLNRVWKWFWEGDLVHFFDWPTLVGTFLWLAWRNFRSGADGEHLWRRNVAGVSLAIVFICGATAAVYHRAWEWLPPREPAHGPARLTAAQSIHLVSSTGGGDLLVLGPGGALKADHFSWWYQTEQHWLRFRQQKGYRSKKGGIIVGAKWVNLCPNPRLPGTNWVEAVGSYRNEMVGIRTDGTLWVSETPPEVQRPRDMPPIVPVAQMVQFGQETNWQSVVQLYPFSVVLLRQDGSLWRWGTNQFSGQMQWPGLRAFVPQPVSGESDWARILPGGTGWSSWVYAWKRDGRAWVIHPPEKGTNAAQVVVERVPSFDNVRWRNLTLFMNCQVGVREDGSLWAWSRGRTDEGRTEGELPARMVRVGPDTDWVRVAGDYTKLVALKTDGSLWRWDAGNHWLNTDVWLKEEAPVRLSTHKDWIGLSSALWGTVSLAADGSLWYWWGFHDQPMLAVSRKPVRLGNILGTQP